MSALAPLLLALAASALFFGLGWFFRDVFDRYRASRPALIPPPADGDDPARHRAAYEGATTGPHRVQRTSFGYPAHTSPGIRGLRPPAGRRGPQVVPSKRVFAADPPPFAPHLASTQDDETQVMPRINSGDPR